MLAYSPEMRVAPLDALTYAVFDELREPDARLPNARALPPLFNWTELELRVKPELADCVPGGRGQRAGALPGSRPAGLVGGPAAAAPADGAGH